MCHVPNPAVGARKEEGCAASLDVSLWRRASVRRSKRERLTRGIESNSISPDPTSDLESLSHTAFEELETIRTTIDGLRSKVSALEGILVLALGKVKEEGGRRYSFGEQDSQSPMFYLPEAPWTSEDIYVEPGVVGGGAGGGYGETERLGDERGRGEERDFLVVTSRGASQKGEDLRGEEVEASIALEFLVSPSSLSVIFPLPVQLLT